MYTVIVVSAISLINDTFNDHLALEDYLAKRDRAISCLAVGVILLVAATLGFIFTANLPRLIQLPIAIIMILGLGSIAKPLTMDWTPYHKPQYGQTLRGLFRAYNNPKEFKSFCRSVDVQKLFRYGWITDVVQGHFNTLCQIAPTLELEDLNTHMQRWSAYANNADGHTQPCQICAP